MRSVLLPLLCAATLHAQTVQGIAVNAATGKPVPAATVQLIETSDDGEPDIYRAQTDAAGRFRFDRVIPGKYRAIADAQGYTRMMPGGNVVARAPRVVVEAAGAVGEISISMIAAAVISGHIADQDGDPLRYVSVEAMHYAYHDGKRVLESAMSARTNDRGEFRLFGLMPGRYYIRATFRAAGNSGFSPVFFPAARDVSRATLLEPPAGGELRSIDMVMRPDTFHSIAGRVVDAQTGELMREIYVIARLNGEAFASGGAQLNDSFTIERLVPGKYILSAQQFGGKSPKSGRIAVDLGNTDITGVVIALSSGLEITGAIRGLPADSKDGHLTMQPEDATYDNYTASIGANGAFAFHNVRPDVYHMLWTLPKGVYVQSIKMGDRILRDDKIDLTGTVGALTVQLALDGGRVQGTVKNAAGEPVPGAVVAMTADPSYDFWSATCDDAGHFEIRDIAPGEYRVLAFEGAPEGAPEDPDFRKSYEKHAVQVQVLPSTQQKIDVVAIPVIR